jgi:hypothetical protein
VVLADQLAGGAAVGDRAPRQAERDELAMVDVAPTIRLLTDLYVYSGLFSHSAARGAE